ncbi:hypothetical protein LR48_Vigan27s001400 [Vigna angularis]|uniref:inorganic diphosphatase n=1 Tax=Phaseolus angularis TaxID=3914 RepID=A0A0L9T4D1_PHAAN|nr:hypothetical protein LR48_Vigan27s001400 [Vigna angularis]
MVQQPGPHQPASSLLPRLLDEASLANELKHFASLIHHILGFFYCVCYNIHWNYGLLPQTWENPSFANSKVEGALGDKDPVDVVEIGERERKIGEVLKVKPLGALAMIDEGELDSKIVAISVDDPKASLVNYVNDIEKHFTVISLLPNYLITSFISLLLFIL